MDSYPILTATALVAFSYLLYKITRKSESSLLVVEPHNSEPIMSMMEMLFPPERDPWKRLIPIAQDPRNQPLCVVPGLYGEKYTIIVNDVDVMKEILVQGQANYNGSETIQRSMLFRDITVLLFGGFHIVNTIGHSWKWRRQAMVPPFQPRRLIPAMFSFIIDRLNELNDELAQAAATGEAVEMDGCMMQLTLDVICQYLFGFSGEGEKNGLDFQDVGAKANMMNELATMSGGALSLWPHIPLIGRTEWAHRPFKPARLRLEAFLRRATAKALEHPDNYLDSNSETPQFRPLVFALAGNPNYEKEASSSLTTDLLALIYAGNETTSHTAAFALGEIAQHPEVQQRIFEEVRDLLGPPPVDPRKITMEVLGRLEYVTAVVRETLRMYPIANASMAQPTKDVTIRGQFIPAGTTILANFRGAQMDPTIFPNPSQFNPSRWLDNSVDIFQDIDQDSVKSALPELAFSIGTHACLGRNLAMLELRGVLAFLVNRYELTLKPGTTIDTQAALTMLPKGGIWVNLKERA